MLESNSSQINPITPIKTMPINVAGTLKYWAESRMINPSPACAPSSSEATTNVHEMDDAALNAVMIAGIAAGTITRTNN